MFPDKVRPYMAPFVTPEDCVICLSEPRDTAVLPCRHMCPVSQRNQSASCCSCWSESLWAVSCFFQSFFWVVCSRFLICCNCPCSIFSARFCQVFAVIALALSGLKWSLFPPDQPAFSSMSCGSGHIYSLIVVIKLVSIWKGPKQPASVQSCPLVDSALWCPVCDLLTK